MESDKITILEKKAEKINKQLTNECKLYYENNYVDYRGYKCWLEMIIRGDSKYLTTGGVS